MKSISKDVFKFLSGAFFDCSDFVDHLFKIVTSNG
jgi:hypothetical protein